MDTELHQSPEISRIQRGVMSFAGFRLDAQKRLLLGPDGKVLSLTAKAFDTLLYLASHPGKILARQKIMDAVWPNAVVEENNLNQAIRAIRKALGDIEHSAIILTVPGHGYSFVADIELEEKTPDTVPRLSLKTLSVILGGLAVVLIIAGMLL